MKKILTAIAIIGAMYSCGNKTQQQEGASTNEFSDIAKNVADEHNAKNSLDYAGTYEGTLPSASGAGMDVTIALTDSTYTKKISYVGKANSTFDSKGKYTWNAEGNTITLQGEDVPNKYFVGENTLTQLDIEGKKITGQLEANYILKKIE